MAYEKYQHVLQVRKGDVVVLNNISFYDEPHLLEMNTAILDTSLNTGEYGTLVFVNALGKGWTPAIFRRKIVDEKAMNDKKQEIANLLNEWGVTLNDMRGGSYTASVLDISRDKFTTIVDEKVEVHSVIAKITITPRKITEKPIQL